MQSPNSDSSTKTNGAYGSEPCDHCGLPAPQRAAGQLTFCCAGCRGAYHLIHQWGLEDYYALRDQLKTGEGRAVDGAATGSVNWDELEESGLLGLSTPRPAGDGAVCSRLAVEGLHCGACVWLIERMAMLSPGWHAARVLLNDHSVEVTYDPQQTQLPEIAARLSRIGYRVTPYIEGGSSQRYRQESRQRLVQIAIAGFCAMNAMWLAVGIYAGEHSGILFSHVQLLRVAGVVLGVIAAFGPGRTFFRGAWAALKTRTPHMDIPLALGIGVGAVAGVVSVSLGRSDVYFDSVAALVFFLLVGRWIQFRQQHRAADAVSLLMRLTPAIATRLEADGQRVKVAADTLTPGDQVVITVGEAVPVDAVVIEGNSSIDRSLLTGESRAVNVTIGQTIEAGVLNLQSPLVAQATHSRADSRISQIMRMVEEASLKRTPIVQLADRVSARFIVAILLLSLLTFAIWAPTSLALAASHTVALLIVSCPCALALATPLAIAVSLGRAAKRKVLIRSGDTLERLSTTGTIWFDKTGTLTTGRPEIVVDPLTNEALALCATLESQSNHALARAFVERAKQRGVELLPIDQLQAIEQVTGAGIRGTIAGHAVTLGTLEFIRRRQLNIDAELVCEVAAIAKRGQTPIIVSIDGTLSVIAIGDAIRPEAATMLSWLKQQGWQVGILSGDHPATVRTTALALGIDAELAHGGLLPEEKLRFIEQSRPAQGPVVMVGDGVNDAAALAAADVGMSIRGGAEASLQAAPVFLADGSLTGVASLIQASKRTVGVIRRNFMVSLAYNAVAISLAVAGIISPLIAAILMPLSSLTILTHTLISPTFDDKPFCDQRALT